MSGSQLKSVFKDFKILQTVIFGINIMLVQSIKSKNFKKLISDGLLPIEYYLKDLLKVFLILVLTIFFISTCNFLIYIFATPKIIPVLEVINWIFEAWAHTGHIYIFYTVFMVFCVYLLPNYGSIVLFIGIQILEALAGSYSNKIFPGLNLDGILPFTELMKYNANNSFIQTIPLILLSALFLAFIWGSLKLIETKEQ